MNIIIDTIRKELIRKIDLQTQKSSQKFSKEELKLYGIKAPVVHMISKDYFSRFESLTKSEIFELCEPLWQSGYFEESVIACNWTYFVRKKFESDDMHVFERWIQNYVNNWASCDTLCNHTVGTLIEMFPENIYRLKEFATSENRWMRRASAVSLIIPARKGKFLSDIFKIADILLTDKDDLVQKGYGWMLKAASQANQKAVFDYVMKNKAVMPRTALRYAIEKMPPELKKKAMEK